MLRIGPEESSAVVMPEIGGAVLGWVSDGAHVLRHAQPDTLMTGNVRGMGAFPLVPFCNRIAYGRFTWEGVTYQLDRNFGDHPHTIHGVGWQRQWQVTNASETDAELELEHTATGEQARHWPFPFHASLRYSLDFGRLTVTLSVENRHSAPAPLGIGLHPYFPRRQGATLQFKAGGVWMNGKNALPSQYGKIPGEWDHTKPVVIGRLRLDNCFTGWNRRASITHVAEGISIEADAAFRHVQVYTPAGRDYFCVEPVSHVPDALNRRDLPTGQAMHVVRPGEALSGSIIIG